MKTFIFQHLPGLQQRPFPFRVGNVPKKQNPARRTPKTEELGGASHFRGPNKSEGTKMTGNGNPFLFAFFVVSQNCHGSTAISKRLENAKRIFRLLAEVDPGSLASCLPPAHSLLRSLPRSLPHSPLHPPPYELHIESTDHWLFGYSGRSLRAGTMLDKPIDQHGDSPTARHGACTRQIMGHCVWCLPW